MSKYDPLYHWLHCQTTKIVPATFSQLEMILGFNLPATARHRCEWWANETGATRHVQCRAWLDAGYETREVDLPREILEFVKAPV